MVKPAPSLNVFNEPLAACSDEPKTGYFRNGCCDTCTQDVGSHTVCVVVTAEFLAYSLEQGNDLTTPNQDMDFPGLRPGDQWCLCAPRWLDAYQAGCAPKVRLQSTHLAATEVIEMSVLRQHAVDVH